MLKIKHISIFNTRENTYSLLILLDNFGDLEWFIRREITENDVVGLTVYIFKSPEQLLNSGFEKL